MTEREKMLAGQLYDCGDAELLAQWHKAKDLVRDYNRLDSADAAQKDRILTELPAGAAPTCGSPRRFTRITATTSILATTAK